jgi:hypothetical protein
MIIMDMNSGKIIEDEFGAFEDEVLNAEWQSQPWPELQVGLQEAAPSSGKHTQAVKDAEAFLRNVYLSQE